ncbi:hypothetical protein F4805DRAFT_314076 [Annulohypoxylon moriforme]|nr:hypothetical protein F4805DRAFT_314076 [Annulohypoxylon moriforme]
MSPYSSPPYSPTSTPGVYSAQIPWHHRRTSPHHRPFGAFASSRPYTPAHLALTTFNAQAVSEYEREEARKQAEWLEWQGRIATTGGPPTPTDHVGPNNNGNNGTNRGCMTTWRETGIFGKARVLYPFFLRLVVFFVGWFATLVGAWKWCSRKYERWYWLRLTAYRQSRWPYVFRRVRNWTLVLLCVVLVAVYVKLRIDDYRAATATKPVVVYRQLSEYQIWSVTPPRCSRECCDPSNTAWAREVEES